MSDPANAGSQPFLNPHLFLNVVTPSTAGDADNASPAGDAATLRNNPSRTTVFPDGGSYFPPTASAIQKKPPPTRFTSHNQRSRASLLSIRQSHGEETESLRLDRPKAMTRISSKGSASSITRARSKRRQNSLKVTKAGIRVDTSCSRHRGEAPKQVFPYPFSRENSGLGIREDKSQEGQDRSASSQESKPPLTHRNKSAHSPGAPRKKSGQRSFGRTAQMAASAPGPEYVEEGDDYFSQKRLVGDAPPIETRMMVGLEKVMPKMSEEAKKALSPASAARLDISPHDRSIFVGMSVPSDSLTNLASSPLHRRVDGSTPVPITPTIVVTPEVNPRKWDQINGTSTQTRHPRPRPASSVYSLNSHRATPVMGVKKAPPVPELPERYNEAPRAEEWTKAPKPASVGEVISQMQPRNRVPRDSNMTLFEEDENEKPAVQGVMTTVIYESDRPTASPGGAHAQAAENMDPDNFCPTPRRSRGWWNVITTPFELSRPSSNWFGGPDASKEAVPDVPKVPDLGALTEAVAQLADATKSTVTTPSSATTTISPFINQANISHPFENIIPEPLFSGDPLKQRSLIKSGLVDEAISLTHEPVKGSDLVKPGITDDGKAGLPTAVAATTVTVNVQFGGDGGYFGSAPRHDLAATQRPPYSTRASSFDRDSSLTRTAVSDRTMRTRSPISDRTWRTKSPISDRTGKTRSPISTWTENTPIVETAKYGSYYKQGSISSSQRIGAPTPRMGLSANPSAFKVPTVRDQRSITSVSAAKVRPGEDMSPWTRAAAAISDRFPREEQVVPTPPGGGTPSPRTLPTKDFEQREASRRHQNHQRATRLEDWSFAPPPGGPAIEQKKRMKKKKKSPAAKKAPVANNAAHFPAHSSFHPRRYQNGPTVTNLEDCSFSPPPNQEPVEKRREEEKKSFFAGLSSLFRRSEKPTLVAFPYEKNAGMGESPRTTDGFAGIYEKSGPPSQKPKTGFSCFGRSGKSRRRGGGEPPDGSGKKKKNRRRIFCCAGILLLLLIILAVVLGVTLGRKRKPDTSRDAPTGSPVDAPNGSPDAPRWLNLTDMPPIPTGVATIAVPEAVKEQSGCVSPATLWSCSLPREDHESVEPNKPNQPNFQVMITFQNTSETQLPGDGGPKSSRSLSSLLSSRILGRRQEVPAPGPPPKPAPAPPGLEDQEFLGNTTDDNAEPFAGESTPFLMTFVSSAHTPPLNTRLSPRANESRPDGDRPGQFKDVSDLIPPPSVARDGTAAAANLLPFPSAQPLRLYNRGGPDEHYGFYTYFDRSIFLKDIRGTPGSFGGNPADVDGGAAKESATQRCTWAQTRFLVQIWTRGGDAMPLLQGGPAPPSGPSSTGVAPAPTSTSAAAVPSLPAAAFARPGSFPYPVTVSLDRHGGSARSKMVYCYGMDSSTRINATAKQFVVEDRAFGGVTVNPAKGPFEEAKGAIDGGKGGCGCQWANWSSA